MKKGVLKNFTKFVGVPFLMIKKKTPAQVFFCEFCTIFKNTTFIEHLRKTDFENEWSCDPWGICDLWN